MIHSPIKFYIHKDTHTYVCTYPSKHTIKHKQMKITHLQTHILEQTYIHICKKHAHIQTQQNTNKRQEGVNTNIYIHKKKNNYIYTYIKKTHTKVTPTHTHAPPVVYGGQK